MKKRKTPIYFCGYTSGVHMVYAAYNDKSWFWCADGWKESSLRFAYLDNNPAYSRCHLYQVRAIEKGIKAHKRTDQPVASSLVAESTPIAPSSNDKEQQLT